MTTAIRRRGRREEPFDEQTPREMSPFSARVKEAWEASGLTPAEIARACDVTQQAISNIINPGKTRKANGCRFADKLARTLGVSVEWLLFGEGPRNPQELSPLVPGAQQGLSLRGLSPLQAGALHTLAELMRANKLPDIELLALLQSAHKPRA